MTAGRAASRPFGAGLGGTFAAVVAAARPDVEGVVLWGPLESGKRYLREVRAFNAVAVANPEGLRPEGWEEGDQEAIGFLIAKETVEDLGGIDALQLEGQLTRAAVFPRNHSVSHARVVAALEGLGAEVHVEAQAVVDMDTLVAEEAMPPRALIAQCVAWWCRSYPELGSAPAEGEPLELAPRVTLLARQGHAVVEEVARFGPRGELFGVLTRGEAVDPGAPGVILINGGTNHRVGINRNYTEWAREWAGLGLCVLRMDVRGLGDSPPLPGAELNALYREETRADVRAACDFLQASRGLRRFACLGLCAGGYQAFHTALEDPRVVAVVMLNPLRFLRDATHHTRLKRPPLEHYRTSLLQLERWRKLARGEVNVPEVARAVGLQFGRRVSAWAGRRVARLRRTEPAPNTQLAADLLRLIERGCEFVIVFNADEPIIERFKQEIAADRVRLTNSGRFWLEWVHHADHILTPLVSQQEAAGILRRTVSRWCTHQEPTRSAP